MDTLSPETTSFDPESETTTGICVHPCSLFRYISELDSLKHQQGSGASKGGYLAGEIHLPPGEGNLEITISTHRDEPNCGHDSKVSCHHPNLLKVIRMNEYRKRCSHLEPQTSSKHWKIKLSIENNKVLLINERSAGDERRFIPERDKLFELTDPRILPIDKLNIAIMLPKQASRAKTEGDVSVDMVLEDRIEDKTKIFEVKQMFRTAKNLKRMKLKVDMKDADGNTHCFMSGSIKDSNSKVSGALNFHDASPLRSCQNGGRKITMSSEFPLSKDVEPIFQLFNASNERQELLEQDLISHPNKENDVRVKNDHIILITPPQPKLATILNMLLSIKLAARRTHGTDVQETPLTESFPFVYDICGTQKCIFCRENVDGIIRPAKIRQERDKPRPGKKKRKLAMPISYLATSLTMSQNEDIEVSDAIKTPENPDINCEETPEVKIEITEALSLLEPNDSNQASMYTEQDLATVKREEYY